MSVSTPASLDIAGSAAARLGEVVAGLRTGLAAFDRDARMFGHNARFANLLGLPGNQMQPGMSFAALLELLRTSEGFATPAGKAFLAAQAALDRARSDNTRLDRPDGLVVELATEPLPEGGWIVTASDISALAQAEATLAGHAVDMEAVLANTRHGMSLWSAQKTLRAFNRMMGELLELPADFLVRGLTQGDLLRRIQAQGAFESEEAEAEFMRTQAAHDRSLPLMIHRRTPSGRLLEVLSDPTPDGGYVISCTDMTAQRRVEAELREAIEAVANANAARAHFLATMSHELRTPLNSVIGFSDTLIRDRGTTDPAQVVEYARDINEAGKRLLMLINNMLDVARIEAGRFDLGTDRIDFIRMAQSCLRQFRAAAAAAEIDLYDEMPADLPLVRGDERRMQQVMVNLLSNAVKFTEPGGSVALTAHVEPEGDLVVQIIDTGIGITEDEIPRLFQPFTQVDSSLARRFEGSGLGLYFSRALVEAHGGTLNLRSLVGQGTTAEIRMPARRLAGDETAINREGSVGGRPARP